MEQRLTRRLVSLELSLEFAVIQVTLFREAVEAIQQHHLAAIVCSYNFGGQANPLELFHFARTRIPKTPRVILADPALALEAHQAVTTNVATVFVGDVGNGVAVLNALRMLRDDKQNQARDERRTSPRWAAAHMDAHLDSNTCFNQPTTVVNLSRGGVLLDLHHGDVGIGQKLHVSFTLPNWRPVRLECCVLRVQRSGRRAMVAAKFLNLGGAGLNALSIALNDAQRLGAGAQL